MRHTGKGYPYQAPSGNRSSKDLNLIIGPASVFPAYLAWSDADLERFAGKCRNPKNVFRETLDSRIAARAARKRSAQQRQAKD